MHYYESTCLISVTSISHQVALVEFVPRQIRNAQWVTHALLHYLCWLCQNLPRISLGVPLPTQHLLSGTVSRQTFYSVILTLFLGNIWKHFCSLPPDWLSSSASVALHMALYKWDYYYYYKVALLFSYIGTSLSFIVVEFTCLDQSLGRLVHSLAGLVLQ